MTFCLLSSFIFCYMSCSFSGTTIMLLGQKKVKYSEKIIDKLRTKTADNPSLNANDSPFLYIVYNSGQYFKKYYVLYPILTIIFVLN